MEYKILGGTDLNVSVLSIGTVELGMDYGIRIPSQFERPDESTSIELIRNAVSSGINFFDTAPAYGTSESVLGKALSGESNCYVATKVLLPDCDGWSIGSIDCERHVMDSIKSSLRKLQRESLEIVQIHNANAGTFANNKLLNVLQSAKDQGLINYVGASVYGVDNALAAIRSENVDILQLPVSILDQRLINTVLPIAASADVGIVARSVLLKGALTSKGEYLPDHLRVLRDAVDRCRSTYDVSWGELPQLAIRYCLGVKGVQSLLVGIRTQTELDFALEAVSAGPLSEEDMRLSYDLALAEENLLNPYYWNIN